MWIRLDTEEDVVFLNLDKITCVRILEEHLRDNIEIVTIDGDDFQFDSRYFNELLTRLSRKTEKYIVVD